MTQIRRYERMGAALAAAFTASLLAASAAPAATITVGTVGDTVAADGVCSLREAISAANEDTAGGGCVAGSGADRVVIPAGTYTLTRAGSATENDNVTDDLDVYNAVTLDGAGAATTTITTNQTNRIVHVAFGLVTIEGVTITGGRTPNGANGADVVGGSIFQTVGGAGAHASDGGGIFNHGTLRVANSRIVGNRTGRG
ncbi:MAG TPA: CSLREA domain-containing protein, partial [Solirubrobacteraceae bacterium]|nr:CSLREA domain-containing protein [Solirubrobacteraceae bacterium]